MAVVLFLATPWLSPTQESVVHGNAKFYDKGIMEQVAVNRGLITDTALYDDWLVLQGLDGAAALMTYGDIGRKFTAVNNGRRLCLVSIDCAGRDHYDKRVELGDVVEFDWQTARKLGMRGVVPTTIIFDTCQKWKRGGPQPR